MLIKLVPTFADLSDNPDPILLPWLDQPAVDERKLAPVQLQWRRDGIAILPKFLPDDLVETYTRRRALLDSPGGWPDPQPYLHVPELRNLALYPPLMEKMRDLIGEQMMLHLALTGWISTEREWHQDDYLNPPEVNSWYAAVWMALDDIHPDSGPFEYVPGSHRWPLMRGQKVRALLAREERRRTDWPSLAGRFTTPAIEAEIAEHGATIRSFVPARGDTLIWHGRLLHRGSKPRRPGMPRKSLITHYTGINHRLDMPKRGQDQNGQFYADRPPRLFRQMRSRVARALGFR